LVWEIIVGIDIFAHSVRLVLGDWRNALRLSGLLYLIYAVPTLLLRLSFPAPAETATMADAAAALSAAPLAFVTSMLALVAFVWIAVAWHRYVLLDEAPAGQFPAFNGSRLFRYALYSLGIGILAVLVGAVVGAIAGVIFSIVPVLLFIAALLSMAAALVVFYRLAPVLPAVAVERPLTFGAAWDATKGASSAIIVLAIVSAVASFVIDVPAMVLNMGGSIGSTLALLWTLGTDWLRMLVGVSILTTLYGHYVEGRSIPSAR
jgi:hypothetical protein